MGLGIQRDILHQIFGGVEPLAVAPRCAKDTLNFPLDPTWHNAQQSYNLAASGLNSLFYVLRWTFIGFANFDFLTQATLYEIDHHSSLAGIDPTAHW